MKETLPPNTRLQRTPAALPPSPLSRKPLGRREVASRVVATLCVAASWACCDSPWYKGDGTIVSHGLGSKFELELGTIDVAKAQRQTYRMADFTPHDLVAGFRVMGKPVEATVRVSLTNGHGQPVIQEQVALSEWVWSQVASNPDSFFVYRRGVSRDVPIGKGTVNVEQVGVRADGGWGTYFHPKRGERYEMLLEVVKPSTAPAVLKAVVKCSEIYAP